MVTYINSGTGYYRATDPDMVFISSLSLDDTMAPGDSIGHPYLYGPCYGMPPDSNQVAGSSPDLWSLCGP